jgi:UDP-galactopyranose mutase
MEPSQPGNNQMPDFDHLNDRVIAQKTSTPTLVIKTNLDPKYSTENNPYYPDKNAKNPKLFRDYFEE